MGSVGYTAPEMLTSSADLMPSDWDLMPSDWWSLGICLAYAATGELRRIQIPTGSPLDRLWTPSRRPLDPL